MEEKMEKTGDTEGEKSGRTGGLLRRLIVAVIIFAIASSGAYIGGGWLYYRFTHATTDNAFVKTDMVNLSPLVSGRIKKLFKEEGDSVKAGEVLAVLDDRDLAKVVEIKRAALERTKREVARLRVTIERTTEEVEKNITVAEKALIAATEQKNSLAADLDRAEKDFRRAEGLLKEGSIPESRFDAAKARYESLRARLRALEATVGLRRAEVEKAEIGRKRVKELQKMLSTLKAAVKVAQKDLESAMVNLGHTEIKSPIDGIVAKRYFNEGDFVSPGMPVYALYNPADMYITANLEETKLKGVRVGQPVDITLDAYPGRTFRGKVLLVGEATGAEFALIPRDVSAGEFTKVVQRVPVRISIPEDSRGLFKPGLSAAIGIDTRR